MVIDIPLAGGLVAIADSEDADLIQGHEWKVTVRRNGLQVMYRDIRLGGGRCQRVFLHRLIARAPEGVEVGFASGNGLDCRRENLVRNPRFGPGNVNWKGDATPPRSQRDRAHCVVRTLGNCEECGKPAVDRHHKDGDTGNNDISNLAQLCRRCHMRIDGRAARLVAMERPIQPPRPCRICGQLSKPLSHGRCHRCDMYVRRTGAERPPVPDARVLSNRARHSSKKLRAGGI